MQDVKTYFVIASLVWMWVETIWPMVSRRKTNLGYKFRNDLMMWLDRKPINCGTCLSFWLGILFTMLTFNILFLSLPIMYKLIHKIL
jgi:hypothetical protein